MTKTPSSPIHKLLSEISELSKQKKELLDRRSALLKKRKTISEKIRERGGIAKSLKGQRDAVVSKVKESKEKRQDVVSRIKENRAKLDQFKGELNSLKTARDVKFLKKQIKAHEWSFQTEPRGYEQEKKLLKLIESLKEELESAKRRDEIISEVKKIADDIRELKKEQEAFHLSVVSKAKDSDDAHEELRLVSETIGGLKKKIEPIDVKLDDTRAKLSEINNEISEKKLKVEAIKARIEEQKKGEEKKELKKRREEVEGKLSKRKRLTTEDILVLQASEEPAQEQI